MKFALKMNNIPKINSVFLDQIIVKSTKECNKVMKKGYKCVTNVALITHNQVSYPNHLNIQIQHQLFRISKRFKSIHHLYLDYNFPMHRFSLEKMKKITKNFSSLRAIDFYEDQPNRKNCQLFLNI